MSETSTGPGEHPKVVDLMDALERSVAEAKEARKRHEATEALVELGRQVDDCHHAGA